MKEKNLGKKVAGALITLLVLLCLWYKGGLFWTLIIVCGAIISFVIAWFVLAERNLYFTFVKEGTAKVVVKGDQVIKILIQWKGYTLDEDWNVVKEGVWIKDGKEVPPGTAGAKIYKEKWHPLGGFRYYGFWPIKDIYIYEFKIPKGESKEGEIILAEKKYLDYILLKEKVYLSEIKDAEDINKLPLKIEFLYTIRVVNPYKALFRIEDWLVAVILRCNAQARDIITRKSYEEWISEPQSMAEELKKRLEELKILKEFEQEYGILLKKVEVKSINPPPGYREATLKKYLAEREKERIETLADAEKERIKRVYETVKALGRTGELVRVCEAVERSPLAASLAVQAIPGLQEVLRGVFGKPPEAITKEEFKELKEMLKKIAKEEK